MGSAVAVRLTRGRHPVGVAASLLAGSAVALLVGVAVLVGTGHRVMIDMSDSMQPAIAAGHVQVVIPKVGYVLNWFRQPAVRFIFLTLASIVLAGIVLARVWGIGPGRRA